MTYLSPLSLWPLVSHNSGAPTPDSDLNWSAERSGLPGRITRVLLSPEQPPWDSALHPGQVSATRAEGRHDERHGGPQPTGLAQLDSRAVGAGPRRAVVAHRVERPAWQGRRWATCEQVDRCVAVLRPGMVGEVRLADEQQAAQTLHGEAVVHLVQHGQAGRVRCGSQHRWDEGRVVQ
eukprot:scaffold14551_cov61-Phaeocystis_antarctica.AAC.3